MVMLNLDRLKKMTNSSSFGGHDFLETFVWENGFHVKADFEGRKPILPSTRKMSQWGAQITWSHLRVWTPLPWERILCRGTKSWKKNYFWQIFLCGCILQIFAKTFAFFWRVPLSPNSEMCRGLSHITDLDMASFHPTLMAGLFLFSHHEAIRSNWSDHKQNTCLSIKLLTCFSLFLICFISQITVLDSVRSEG